MRTRRYTPLPGMTIAVMLTLLVGQGLVFGHDDGDRTAPSKLEGTWNVGSCPSSVRVNTRGLPGDHHRSKKA